MENRIENIVKQLEDKPAFLTIVENMLNASSVTYDYKVMETEYGGPLYKAKTGKDFAIDTIVHSIIWYEVRERSHK
jgi:hypothetical protein